MTDETLKAQAYWLAHDAPSASVYREAMHAIYARHPYDRDAARREGEDWLATQPKTSQLTELPEWALEPPPRAQVPPKTRARKQPRPEPAPGPAPAAAPAFREGDQGRVPQLRSQGGEGLAEGLPADYRDPPDRPPSPPRSPTPRPPSPPPADLSGVAADDQARLLAQLTHEAAMAVEPAAEAAAAALELPSAYDPDKAAVPGEAAALAAMRAWVDETLGEASEQEIVRFRGFQLKEPQERTVRALTRLLAKGGAAVLNSPTGSGKTAMLALALMSAGIEGAGPGKSFAVVGFVPRLIQEQHAGVWRQLGADLGRTVRVACLGTSKDAPPLPGLRSLGVTRGTQLHEAMTPGPDGEILVVLVALHLLGKPHYVQTFLTGAVAHWMERVLVFFDETHNSGARNAREAYSNFALIAARGLCHGAVLASATPLQRRPAEAQHYAYLLSQSMRESAAEAPRQLLRETGGLLSLAGAAALLGTLSAVVDLEGFRKMSWGASLVTAVAEVESPARPSPAALAALAREPASEALRVVVANPVYHAFVELVRGFLRAQPAGDTTRVIGVAKHRRGVDAIAERLGGLGIEVFALTQATPPEERARLEALKAGQTSFALITTFDLDGLDIWGTKLVVSLTIHYGLSMAQLAGRAARGPGAANGAALMLVPAGRAQRLLEQFRRTLTPFRAFYGDDMLPPALGGAPTPLAPHQAEWLGAELGGRLPRLGALAAAADFTRRRPQLVLWPGLCRFPPAAE